MPHTREVEVSTNIGKCTMKLKIINGTEEIFGAGGRT